MISTSHSDEKRADTARGMEVAKPVGAIQYNKYMGETDLKDQMFFIYT